MMLKITKTFADHLEDLRQKPLRQRMQSAFDALWYNSIIPDAGTEAMQRACDLIFPDDADNDDTLQAKGFLIQALANNVFGSDADSDQTAKFEIEACVFPDVNRSEIDELIEQQKSEA